MPSDSRADAAPSAEPPAEPALPVALRAQKFVEAIKAVAKVSEVKGMEMAGLRQATRERVSIAAQVTASCHLLAAALIDAEDREATLFAVTLMVLESMEALARRRAHAPPAAATAPRRLGATAA